MKPKCLFAGVIYSSKFLISVHHQCRTVWLRLTGNFSRAGGGTSQLLCPGGGFWWGT